MSYIYALVDPLTKAVRYVGKTKNSLTKRLRDHIKDSHRVMTKTGRRKVNKRYAWIISLINKGELPTITLLETVSSVDANDAECSWISQFPNLTNMTPGGDGGDTNTGRKFGARSAEQLKRIADGTRAAMKEENVRAKCRLGNAITRQKMKGSDGKMRPDLVEKIREGAKKRVIVLREGQELHFNSMVEFFSACGVNRNRWNRKVRQGLDPEFTLLSVRRG